MYVTVQASRFEFCNAKEEHDIIWSLGPLVEGNTVHEFIAMGAGGIGGG